MKRRPVYFLHYPKSEKVRFSKEYYLTLELAEKYADDVRRILKEEVLIMCIPFLVEE